MNRQVWMYQPRKVFCSMGVPSAATLCGWRIGSRLMGSLSHNGLKMASRARGMAWRPWSVLAVKSRVIVSQLSTYPLIVISCSRGMVTSASCAFLNGVVAVLGLVGGTTHANYELSVIGSHSLQAAMPFVRL